MKVTIKAKHLLLTEALKDYARKKLGRLEKHFDHILSADVMLSTERNFHVVEVTVHANGIILRGVEKTDNMYSSIDKVLDKLDRQVQKHKEKLQDHHRVKEESPRSSVEDKSSVRISLKRQRVPVFTAEEAAEEMERRGYNFYLFCNRDTSDVNLIYRRENGNLAVLEPIV